MNNLITEFADNHVYQIIPVLAGMFLHSTLITGLILLLLKVVKNRETALQSMIIRGGLVALVCMPLAQMLLVFNGIQIPLPGIDFSYQTDKINSTLELEQPVSPLFHNNSAQPILTHPEISGHTSPFQHRLDSESVDMDLKPDSQERIGTYRQNVSTSTVPLNREQQHSGYEQKRENQSPVSILPDTEERGTTAPMSEHQRSRIFYPAVIIVWIALTILMSLRMLAGVWYVRHLHRTATLGQTSYQQRCKIIANRLQLSPPPVYEHPGIVSTFLAGLFHPFIMIPVSGNNDLHASNEVLMHELAHLKHHDVHWHILGQLLLLLYPLQPLLWILIRKAEIISDYRADDYVVTLSENNLVYARTLHGIACALTVKKQTTHEYVPAISIFNPKSSLTIRITRILDKNRSRPLTARIRDLVTLSVLLTCTIVFTGFVHFVPSHTDHETKQQITSTRATGSGNTSALLKPPDKSIDSTHKEDSVFPDAEIYTAQSYTRNVVEEQIAVVSSPEQTHDISNTELTEYGDVWISKGTETEVQPELAEAGDNKSFETTDASSERDEQIAAQMGNDTVISADSSISETTKPDQETPFSEDMNGIADTGELIGTTDEPEAIFAFRGEPLPAIRNATRIQIPAAKPVNVIIENYDSEEYDLSDPEQRKQYLLYKSLEENHNEPAWSPDGKWIAFTDFNRIWIVPADGGEPKLVYENFHTGTNYTVGGIRALTYSADGTTLTFQKNVYDIQRGSRFKEYDNGIAIFSKPVVNVEQVEIETGAHKVLVNDAYQCLWSPSGKYLFFLTWNKLDDPSQGFWEQHNQPMLLDTTTNKTHLLDLPGEGQIGNAAFLPDESALIIPCREGTISDLWKIDLETGIQTNLTSGIPSVRSYRYYDYPTCSPDGRWVLFTNFAAIGEEVNRRLMLISLESGEMFDLIGAINGNASHGIWSPDGKHICFLEEEPGGSYLHVIDFYSNQYPVAKPSAAQEDEVQPIAFDLVGNYPNPFNPVTRIEYSIETAGEVTLDIHNVLGQLVRRLVHDTQQAGHYAPLWDGRDDRGIEVSAGVYFARLVSGNRVAKIKMTLQK